jgi:CelD/BcsL family acetyltransferase involved in cellulose biosynthesis
MSRWKILPAAAFEVHRDLWDSLNRSNADHPLLDSAFVEALLRHFGSKATRLAVSCDRDHPGIALIERKSLGSWQTFQPSQAPLGLIMMGAAPAYGQVDALLRSLPGYVLAFSVFQQDPDFTAFPDSTRPALAQRLDYIQTPRLTLSGPFEIYWQSRGKNLVHNLTRQRRRLAQHGGHLELAVDREASLVAEGMRAYGVLESKGWKGAEGTAVTAENGQGLFYREVLESFCQRGEGVVYRLLLDGRAIAVDLCLERGGTLVILKTTYEEEIAGLSPGLLLHQEIFKAAFSDPRLKVIEFYGPVRDWHTKWTTETRTMYHLTFHRGAWVPRANILVRAYAHALGRG